MTLYGKIETYDNASGAGTITPESGGEALAFDKSNLQHQGEQPRVGQRYAYDTHQRAGGQQRAVHLELQHREHWPKAPRH